MPNWTFNKVHVDDLSVIKEKVFNDEGELDFNLIIPEPTKKEDCDPKYYVNENSHVMLDNERPWFNWYDWHCDNWGTKWNCDFGTIDGNSMTFYTAWSDANPIIVKLSEMFPKQEIKYEFAYEDDGYEVIYVAKYKNGKRIKR